MRGWSRRIGADLSTIAPLLNRYIFDRWWKLATLLQAVNLKIQMQDSGEQHGGEKVFHPTFALCNDLNSIQRMLKETKDQFNGMITNDKFCCTRWGQLHLSWWRRPLRLRQ